MMSMVDPAAAVVIAELLRHILLRRLFTGPARRA